MTGALVHPGPPAAPPARAITLVWVDAREASVVRWVAGTFAVERIESDVPAHRRATGHVRHDPNVRHGGGGVPQTAGEPHRLEHLARFLDAIAAVLPDRDDLLIMGPGEIREHLARRIEERDRRHRVVREIATDAASRMTRRQLVARLRRAAGDEPRRRVVGAYRWTDGSLGAASARRSVAPRRVVAKPPTRPEGWRGGVT